VLAAGLFLFAVGTVCFLESRLGLPPWDVFHQGLAKHTPLSFGQAIIVTGLVIVAFAWWLGAKIGIGTLANATLVGTFVELLTASDAIDSLSDAPLAARVGLLALGVLTIGLGSGLYLGAQLGAGPRDSLMVVGAQRTPLRIAAVRAALEIAALLAGIGLGGTVGVGTLAFALLVGPSVELGFWVLIRARLAQPAPAY
jgi:uncharacterized membrane protein YczE